MMRTRKSLSAGKVGIGDAGQKPPRSRRHALILACEGAVAQSRKFVALNAERIPRADRVRGKRASPLAASAIKTMLRMVSFL
jgi:hypothetical protein